MKRDLESQYDFSFAKAFSAIDDWNYGFIDMSNLKRFLMKQQTATTNKDLVAIIRRYDVDGDCKLSLKEF